MINTNELRRNNLIMYGNMIYPVDRITETSISVRLSSQSLRTARPHEFEPVALTPEILQACGFGKDGRDVAAVQYYINGQMSIVEYEPAFQGDTDEFYYGYRTDDGWISQSAELKYLHQIQNLFFALTNSELTVNVEKVSI